MEEFTKTVKDRGLQMRLIQAFQKKKPFAHFKNIIDNSTYRQKWFDFKDEAYIEFAKEWIEENANAPLKEKIKSLSSLFITK